jgi:2-dehydro-3-deoxygluconokinase
MKRLPNTLKQFDVLTIGETMLRLSPPRGQRLEQAGCLEVAVGGAESNVAVALSRLGLRVAWLSRLVDNALGRRVVQTLRAHGVDVSHVIWASQGRIGLYFVEFGAPPRLTEVIYDRQGSAMSAMTLGDMSQALLDDTRLVHLTGITPALSPQCRELVAGVLRMAADRKVLRSFDVNYRTKLWTESEARAVMEDLCEGLDVLFLTEQDMLRLFGDHRVGGAALNWLQDRFLVKTAVLTLGEDGAMAVDREGRMHRVQGFSSREVDPLGSGDAFASGFLYVYLTAGEDQVERALQLGASAAAMKRTIAGDLALISLEEIQQVLSDSGDQIRR